MYGAWLAARDKSVENNTANAMGSSRDGPDRVVQIKPNDTNNRLTRRKFSALHISNGYVDL